MGAKSTTTHAGHADLRPLPWVVPPPALKGLQVVELFGDEAESQWAAAWLNQYLDPDERAFADTAPAPLL